MGGGWLQEKMAENVSPPALNSSVFKAQRIAGVRGKQGLACDTQPRWNGSI